MPKTACYICNFNGKEYVEKCISSVLEQAQVNELFHLYLIDNASTDGTVECVKEKFGAIVEIIQNSVNLGGAGGFNVALKDAIAKKYDYVVLLDNDVTLAPDCISNLIRYMDEHSDVGCAGAKIMIMDHPEYIQEFGVHLDFEHYGLIHDYFGEMDRGTEYVIESDCVASCALIARISCLNQTNLFPTENFLYWDDLEFTYQIKLAGYKVVSLASAVVYHKGKKKEATDTALGYYGMRNRVKFFSKYEKEERLPHLCRNILDDCFQFFFGNALKGLHASNSSRMFALDDFVHKHYGKVDGYKIYSMDRKEDKIKKIVEDQKAVYIELPNKNDPILMKCVGTLCRRLDEVKSIGQVRIVLTQDMEQDDIQEILKCYYEKEAEYVHSINSNGIVFRPCLHVKDVTEDISPIIWIDQYLNCIKDNDDFKWIQSYPYIKEFFINIHYEWLMQGILNERKRGYLTNEV